MERKEFLKSLGVLGAGLLVSSRGQSCDVIRTETAGPFVILPGQMAATLRTDMREEQPGQLHRMKFRILRNTDCTPIENAEVLAWHCNVNGNYSGYNTSGNIVLNATGQNWLRGRALTDSNGEVEFTTIFPGWYPGRVTHVHLQVKINGTSVKMTQFTYPQAEKNIIHSQAPYTTWGLDPVPASSDGSFADGTAGQVASLTLNEENQSWDSFLELTVPDLVVLGVKNEERITGGQFELGQNFPNPFESVTSIPFALKNAATVSLGLYDMQGKRVALVQPTELPAGDHTFTVDLPALNLPQAHYVYELTVSNDAGTYHQCKRMTSI
jgi:hypothetical protein